MGVAYGVSDRGFLYQVNPTTAGTILIGQFLAGAGGGAIIDVDFDLSPIPEPTTLAIFGLALVGLGVMRRRRAA